MKDLIKALDQGLSHAETAMSDADCASAFLRDAFDLLAELAEEKEEVFGELADKAESIQGNVYQAQSQIESELAELEQLLELCRSMK